MTEAGTNVDVTELRTRLSNEWRIEEVEAGVYGFADDDGRVGTTCSGTVPACFIIQQDGGLWVATWKDPHQLGEDPRVESDRVTGTRERCVEWVVERGCRTRGQSKD